MTPPKNGGVNPDDEHDPELFRIAVCMIIVTLILLCAVSFIPIP